MGEQAAEHVHDWRVDPFIILPTNPPQRRLVCADCGYARPSGIRFGGSTPSNDPLTWPRWEGGER